MNKNLKKPKIKYIDDGRTIADMSNIPTRSPLLNKSTTSSFKEIWHTYWSAVKMMIKPMFVVIGFLVVIYLIATLIFWLM